jgi:hypothetical protein
VLRPKEREEGELEPVRIARKQFADTVELAIGQTERSVERSFRDGAQKATPL